MKPWFRVCATFEEEAQADRDYWQQFSPGARVAPIDRMREEWASMTGEPKPNRDQIEFVALLARHEVRALIVGAPRARLPRQTALHQRPRYLDRNVR